MERDGRDAAVRVTELLVRASLPNLDEAKSLEPSHDFPRLENWERAHERRSGDEDRLRADELRLQRRFTILEQHGDDLAEVRLELVQGLRLTVRSWEAWYVTHVEVRGGIALDDGGIGTHGGWLGRGMLNNTVPA